ncbi:MAG: nucleotidyltransferase domain-containing protein [Desulfurispora sp.]|uniref:nucleotidyltransferase domain-containing protein n=1 Tax=Desulfurispora sp. TaxID=3014275 RepID=UPI00404B6CDF
MQLVKTDLPVVAEQVSRVLVDFPQVAAAYIFGSALELSRPDSDIDLGLVLQKDIAPDSQSAFLLEGQIAARLEPVDGRVFDINFIDPARPILAVRIFHQGRLIYCQDRDRLSDVMEQASRLYAEVYPRYRRALEEIFSS